VINCGPLGATREDRSLSPADHRTDLLKKRFFGSALIQSAKTVRVRRQYNVYACGEEDGALYWIQSGHIKMVVNSRQGKECILDIYAAGDFFGESCLAGLEARAETATAMENVVLKSVSCHRFLADLNSSELLAFIRELSKRKVEQHLLMADMVTMSSEFRLGRILLRLGSRVGKAQPSGTVIDCRISQEELSHMVGTTRPRITEFMTRFRRLGLISLSAKRQIVLKEARLMAYLSSLV
jgi:CRP/FNR family transcriptional regulator, cyclic AMP receptor protein